MSCLVIFCSCFFFFSPFSIAITSLGEEFALVLFCLFPLLLGVWDGLRFVIVALPGLFTWFTYPSMLTFGKGLIYFVHFFCIQSGETA